MSRDRFDIIKLEIQSLGSVSARLVTLAFIFAMSLQHGRDCCLTQIWLKVADHMTQRAGIGTRERPQRTKRKNVCWSGKEVLKVESAEPIGIPLATS